MGELPTLKVKAMGLELRRVEMFSDERIVDILNKAEALGFDLSAVPSPLEELTLRELDILTAETRGRD